MAFHTLTDSDELIREDPNVLEQQIIDYIISREGVARATKSLRLVAIGNFSINDVALNIQRRVIDRPYTLEEVSRMLAVSDERMRVIVLFLASTGMRIGGLAGLKISSLEKIEEHGLYRLNVYAGSS